VTKGQILAKLDPTAAQSELAQTQARFIELQLRQERLRAVLEHRQPDFTAISREFPDLVADQQQIWSGQVAAHKSAIEVLASQVDQKHKELQQYQNLLNTALKQQKLTADQLEIRRQGVDAGVVSLQTYLETKRAEVTAEGEVQRLQDQVRMVNESLSEAHKRQQNLSETQIQDAQSELGAAGGEFEQVKSNLVKLQDRLDRTEIKAPVAGLVQDLKVHTIGEILPAGGILCRLVPAEDRLQAEVRFSPVDIGHIQTGQPVKVKVGAYEYVRYGPLTGKLTQISGTTFTDEQNKPYYRGIVELDRAYMGPAVGQNPLLPGMTVEADVITGNKSLIEYLLKPVFVSLKDAFHER
jgi:HlyD family secretion protein/adhesin transport system membrane fusion protein